MADPAVCAFETVLVAEVSMRLLRCARRRKIPCRITTRRREFQNQQKLTYLELGAKGGHGLDFGHGAR